MNSPPAPQPAQTEWTPWPCLLRLLVLLVALPFSGLFAFFAHLAHQPAGSEQLLSTLVIKYSYCAVPVTCLLGILLVFAELVTREASLSRLGWRLPLVPVAIVLLFALFENL